MPDAYEMLITRHGGPEVIERRDRVLPAPSVGEVLLRQTAVGLNFVDIYHRAGQFGAHDGPPLPAVLGVQGAGVVEAIGPGVEGIAPGDKVAYVGTPGAYADRRLIAASRLIRLPPDVTERFAAATLVRGLTAEYLLHRLRPIEPGETVLIHAAATGVGLIASQWARAMGLRVIGTASTAEKAAVAREHGCDHALVYTAEDWVARVRELTDGRGVAVAFDGIGRDTFMGSLACLRTRGLAVNFGTTSGQVEAFPLQRLHGRSLSVCRPTLPNFMEDRAEYEQMAERFFSAARDGAIQVPRGPSFPLADAAEAHAAFEQRRISGVPVLIP